MRFVPLIGEQGWSARSRRARGTPAPARVPLIARGAPSRPRQIGKLIAECAEPIARIDDAPLDGLLERVGDARVVLLGECTHGTSEFYRMRARITQALIERRGFSAVAVEADWPDAATLDRAVRGKRPSPRAWQPFARFPRWMWRNRETAALIAWLREHNARVGDPARQVSFSGLDLYSLYTSAAEVIGYLDRIDPPAAQLARERYGRMTPWEHDPAAYGHAVTLVGRHRAKTRWCRCSASLLARRLDYAARDGDEFFDAAQNARVVAGAERYYRAMYRGSVESWNLRDVHMFDTLRSVLAHRGTGSKLVVWEHNSHIGDASATEMAVRGELNVGQLCRQAFGDGVFSVGSDRSRHRRPRPVRGMRRWSECASVRRATTATSGCVATAACRRSRSTCASRCGPSSAPSSPSRASNAQSASCIGPTPSSRAITSRPPCPTSSMSTSGSPRPKRSRSSHPRRSSSPQP